MMVDVPVWLAHLRTDRRGLPVPYINLWGLATKENTDVRWDPTIGMTACFQDDEAGEWPDFTAQNIQRQRECVCLGKCQVCARDVPWSRRFLVIADLSVEPIELQGREWSVIVEPWLCERCAWFAMDVCPALIRRSRSDRLRLIKVTSKTQAKIVVSTGWVGTEAHAAETLENNVAMWAKILLEPEVLLQAGTVLVGHDDLAGDSGRMKEE